LNDPASLTQRLQSFMNGDSAAADSLLREVMPKLCEIAVRELKRERYMAPLQKTELIDELWVRHLSKRGWQVRDRGHFFALASLAMRQVLVDLARQRLAQRRRTPEGTIHLEGAADLPAGGLDQAQQIVEIGLLMDQLEERDSDAARIVDMVYFAGFTLEEAAKETGLTFRQVRSRWDRGRKWLKSALKSARHKP
jgi:RNA polymerase sigma factor (TIGR02999 family)